MQKPLLGALGPTATNAQLVGAGFNAVVIGANWGTINTSSGVYSSAAMTTLQGEITAAVDAGLVVVLDLGAQYAPAWVIALANSQYTDQYGDLYTGAVGSGDYIANTITNPTIQALLGDYIAHLGANLTGVSAVRLGCGPVGEFNYPYDAFGANTNCFWFYDTYSQALLPTTAQGWTPGTGTTTQAQDFVDAYLLAITNFGVWLVETTQTAFPAGTKLEMLLPSWGIRPTGADSIATAVADLLDNESGVVNQGLDWAGLLAALEGYSDVVAYTTWADTTYGTPVTNPAPAVFIQTILPAGMLAGGESTGNGGTTSTGEALMFSDAWTYGWYGVFWMFNGQSQSLANVSAVFESYSTIPKVRYLNSGGPRLRLAASPVTVKNGQRLSLLGGTYHFDANIDDSSEPFFAVSDGNPDFVVAESAIAQGTPYSQPGGYPFVGKGCHWGWCTTSSGMPILVSGITTGVVTTSVTISTPAVGVWDAAYDIWFNVASSTNDNSVGGLEMMVWLNHLGAIQPAGSLIASGVVIGGNAYNVWYGGTAPGGTVSYVLVTPVLSLSLDLAPLAADAVTRGYMLSSWYLIEVPFGFEIWQGGEGLFVQSFEVAVT